MNETLTKVAQWAIGSVGSTRACALIRMSIAVNLWVRFSKWLLLYKAMPSERTLLSVVFFVSTTAMFFGIKSRLSSALSALCAVLLVGYEGYYLGYKPWTHHHVYVLVAAAVFVALTPCGRSLSFDRWWALRQAKRLGKAAPPERGNLFGQRLMALQVCSIYFWTASQKTDWAFLSGDRMEAILMRFYVWDYPEAAWFPPLMALISIVTVALEYALAFGLFFRLGRRWLIIPGMLLHGLFYVLLPISVFSTTMWTLYLAFFDPEAVHRFVGDLTRDTDEEVPVSE